MKRIVILFVAILVGVFGVLFSMGRNSDYAAERALWYINQEFLGLSRDPQAIPQNAFNKVIKQYQDFPNQFPSSKLIPLAKISEARVYAIRKDNATAIKKLEAVTIEYQNNPDVATQALAEIGQIYIAQADDQGVLRIYQRVLKEYPLSDLGLRTPLLIAKFYFQKKDLDKAKQAFGTAEVHYQGIIQKYPNSFAEFNSLRLLATCYMAENKLREAVKTFGDVLLKYPNPDYLTPESADYLIRNITGISVEKLKEYDLAINIYASFMKKYPNHSINKSLKQLVVGLNELKQKGK